MGLLKAPRMAHSASLTTGLAALHCFARAQASIKHSARESSYSQGSTAFSFHFFKNQKQTNKKKQRTFMLKKMLSYVLLIYSPLYQHCCNVEFLRLF